MVSKDEGLQVLWPAYFDRSLTRGQGRRVSKASAVNSPKVEDIAKVVRKLKLKHRVENAAAYPAAPHKVTGRVVVNSDIEKTKLVRWVAKRLK